MVRTSRRRLAEYVAERLLEDDQSIIKELAALIIADRREREIELSVCDIEESLAQRGTLVVTVETATKLTDTVRAEIINLLDSPDVRLREIVAPELIGGVRVRTPGAVLDETIVQKLHTLKSKKI